MSAVSLSESPDRDDDDRLLAGRSREFIQSLERGLGIIRAFGPQAPEQTVSELEEGLVAIAAPVTGRHGRAIGAINLSTHVLRRSVESVRAELPEPLLRTARAIEADLVGVA
jgi:Bacterial transcriptional regulator